MENSNKVYLDDQQIIVIEVVGDQDVTSVEQMGRHTDTLITELRSTGKPALVLDNLLQMGNVGTEARNLVVELGRQLDYDKLAMLGKGGLMRFGTNLMLRATGRYSKAHYFDDETAARKWLKS